jgi:cell shape-determining protein MreD
MAVLLAIPVLLTLLILQMGLVSNMPLLHGSADLLLLALVAWALNKRVRTAWLWAVLAGLMVAFVSALPPGVALVGYLVAVGLALLIRQRIWHMPLLAML